MISLPFFARRMRHGLPLFGARAAIVLGVGLAIAPTSVLADVHVAGSPEAVSIDAQNTSIKEILAALGNAFDVHYQSSANLEKQLTGTYEGSLQRVVMRVLEGYNVVVKTSNGRIEITVLGTRNASAMAGASPASTASKAAPIPPAPPALTSKSSNVAEPPAATTPAAQPSPVIKDAELPVPAASSDAPSPTIKLTEGPMPAIPSASLGSASSAVPEERPSTAMPPSPSVGSAPSSVLEGRPSTVAPQVPGFVASNAPGPQASAVAPPSVAGTTKTPIVDNPPPARQ